MIPSENSYLVEFWERLPHQVTTFLVAFFFSNNLKKTNKHHFDQDQNLLQSFDVFKSNQWIHFSLWSQKFSILVRIENLIKHIDKDEKIRNMSELLETRGRPRTAGGRGVIPSPPPKTNDILYQHIPIHPLSCPSTSPRIPGSACASRAWCERTSDWPSSTVGPFYSV